MLKKLKASGEKYDVILVPGDLVAHGVPLTPGTSEGNYTLLKETLARVAQSFIEFFPDTLVLPSMGNNDGKYHYLGIDKADKADYYGFFFDHWFKAHPTNRKLPGLSTVEQSFKYGGYYRVDIDAKLSILAVNTLYMNKKNDFTNQGSEAQDLIDWLKANLAGAKTSGRKFIITNHIYPGAKYSDKSNNLLVDQYNNEYFDLLSQYRDFIVAEVVAHDHYSDTRYHTETDTTGKKYYYHNMLVSPGITPIDGQNPGFATFTVDPTTLNPEDWQLRFLQLEKTYGWDKLPTDLSLYPFRDFSPAPYGLFSLRAEAIKDFKNALDADQNLLYRYLVAKIGYDPSDPVEYEKGMQIYIQKLGIVSATARKTYKFICQMHLNKNAAEMDACIASNKLKEQPKFLAF